MKVTHSIRLEWMLIGMLGVASWFTPVLAQQTITSPPPAQAVFIPDGGATALRKHPSLPILYVCTQREPKAINLVTYRLNADGSLATGGERTYGKEMFVVGTNTVFECGSLPPWVMAEDKMLLLAAMPSSLPMYYSNSNKNEFAVLNLDEEGQPTKLASAFRIDCTARESLTGVFWEPITRRVYASYYAFSYWFELGRDGAPVDKRCRGVPLLVNYWYWTYVPEWQRFFAMQAGGGRTISIFRFTAEGSGMDFFQALPALRGAWPCGNIIANPKFRKLYALDNTPTDELIVHSLTREGQLTGVPRNFSLGEALFMQFDFKAGLLYAFAKGGLLRIFKLDEHGYPSGAPQLCNLASGEVRDALVDENNGKVYIACTQPPAGK